MCPVMDTTMTSRGKSAVKLLVFTAIFLLLIIKSESKSKMDYRARVDLARKHYQRVASQITCGLPRPKLFRVETTSMQLVPSATILHRCGESSGCCSLATHKCVARTREKVKLYFMVKTLPDLTQRRRKRNKIKKFVFYNHTGCYCKDASYKPR